VRAAGAAGSRRQRRRAGPLAAAGPAPAAVPDAPAAAAPAAAGPGAPAVGAPAAPAAAAGILRRAWAQGRAEARPWLRRGTQSGRRAVPLVERSWQILAPWVVWSQGRGGAAQASLRSQDCQRVPAAWRGSGLPGFRLGGARLSSACWPGRTGWGARVTPAAAAAAATAAVAVGAGAELPASLARSSRKRMRLRRHGLAAWLELHGRAAGTGCCSALSDMFDSACMHVGRTWTQLVSRPCVRDVIRPKLGRRLPGRLAVRLLACLLRGLPLRGNSGNQGGARLWCMPHAWVCCMDMSVCACNAYPRSQCCRPGRPAC
jgi:hypothetical protein